MTELDYTRRSALGFGTAALIAGAAGAASKAVPPKSAWATVDAQIDAIVAQKIAPGLTFTAMRGGKIVHERLAGLANLEFGVRPAPVGPWRIGSITKQFTAAAMLLLAEQGKLSIDDKLARFFPGFPRADTITLRQLLHHTSGLGNYINDPNFLQNARMDSNDDALMKAILAQKPLFLFDPGTSWAYSNSGYLLLGMIIAKTSGLPYGDHMRAALFEPLGLTGTRADDTRDVVPARVSGYSPDAKAPGGFVNASFVAMSYPGAAGCLRSTTSDLCKWHDALLFGKLLTPVSLAAMLAPGTLNDGALPQVGPPNGPKTVVRYGMGIMINPTDGGTQITHSGGIQGFTADIVTLQEKRLTVAIVLNVDQNPGNSLALNTALTELLEAAMKAAASS